MAGKKDLKELCKVFCLIDSEDEMHNFLKDLCTPNELSSFSERWEVCKLLHKGMSYRDIKVEIKSSLTTISRVARFLKDERYNGYQSVLRKLEDKK